MRKAAGTCLPILAFRIPSRNWSRRNSTVQIYQILRDRKITQTEAARLLGTTQAQVSALMRCRPVSVSVGKLMEFLTTLGQDVEVTVKPTARRGAGHMSVTVHA